MQINIKTGPGARTTMKSWNKSSIGGLKWNSITSNSSDSLVRERATGKWISFQRLDQISEIFSWILSTSCNNSDKLTCSTAAHKPADEPLVVSPDVDRMLLSSLLNKRLFCGRWAACWDADCSRQNPATMKPLQFWRRPEKLVVFSQNLDLSLAFCY